MLKKLGKKNKDGGGKSPGKDAASSSAAAAAENQLLPGGIDPTSPDARRLNNVQEIPFDKLKLYFLIIKINKGIDLKAADMTLKGGNSDPFCEVIANKQTFSTKTIMESLNPEWNEETTFCFFNLVEQIEFKVWDWDKGTKHDSIGNCFLNTKDFYNENNNGFEGDIKLENVNKGSINVSVKGRLIIPRELEIRCENLTKLKSEQNEIILNKTNELNNLKTENEKLTNDKEMKTNELTQLNENIEKLNNEKESLIKNNEKLKSDIDSEIEAIKNIDKETEEHKSKTGELEASLQETKESLESEKERKEELMDHLESLRSGALGKLGKGIGKGLGKGMGMIGRMGSNISSSVTGHDEKKSDANTGTTAASTSTTGGKNGGSARSSQVENPEAGHMNVGWIRHNAPRESLVKYQHDLNPSTSPPIDENDSGSNAGQPLVNK